MANQRWWKVPEDDLHNVRSFQKQKQATTNKQNQKKKYTTHKYPQLPKNKQTSKQKQSKYKQTNKNKANTKQNKKQEPHIPVTKLFLQHKTFN